MSFYKKEDNQLLEGPNFVEGPEFSLYKEFKDTYTYPVYDWYWFDTIEEAETFFNIPKE